MTPDKEVADQYSREFRTACQFMEKADVKYTPLCLTGYDYVIAVEMGCEFIEVDEGLKESVEFLKPLVLERSAGAQWCELVGDERAGGLSVNQEEE